MIDNEGSHQPSLSPWLRQYMRCGLVTRFCMALAVACLFLLVLYPWPDAFYPEGNWLHGPLWLFKIEATGDKVIGGVVTLLLLPILFAWVVKPNPFTVLVAVGGAIMWVGFGMWLAALAVA